MKVEVVYALPDAQGCYLSTEVPNNTTITQALDYVRFFDLFPEVDLAKNKVGVFGKQVLPNYVLAEGDRIEIYRPIYFDAKAQRQHEYLESRRQQPKRKRYSKK